MPKTVTLIARIDGEEKALDLTPSQIETLTAYIGDHPEYSNIGVWCLAQIQGAMPAIVAAYHLDPGVQEANQALADAQARIQQAIAAASALGK